MKRMPESFKELMNCRPIFPRWLCDYSSNGNRDSYRLIVGRNLKDDSILVDAAMLFRFDGFWHAFVLCLEDPAAYDPIGVYRRRIDAKRAVYVRMFTCPCMPMNNH